MSSDGSDSIGGVALERPRVIEFTLFPFRPVENDSQEEGQYGGNKYACFDQAKEMEMIIGLNELQAVKKFGAQ